MQEREQLLKYFEEHLDDMLKDLEGFVNLDSPSYENKAASDKCGAYIKGLFEKVGFKIETLPQTTCADHMIARMGEGERGTMIVGHFDTVFPMGTAAARPFRVEGDKAYGPGALDMKGGLIMGLYAVKALKELGLMPKKRITVCMNGDEEPGSFTSSDFIVEQAKLHDNVLVLEPGYDEIGSMKACRFSRGFYELTAHGRAAHSGTAPEQGINPLKELALQLAEIVKWDDLEHGVTVTPTWFDGGIHGTCMIPETAKLSFDVRTESTDLAWELDKKFHSLKPIMEGMKLEVSGTVDKPPLPRYEDLIAKAAEIAASYGVELKPTVCRGGSDGNFTGGAGVPTLDGIGMSGLYLHNPAEYINVKHIPKRTALVAELLRTL